MHRGLWALLGLGILAGCAGLAEKPVRVESGQFVSDPLPRFHLEGRISVKTEDQAFSGSIRWQHAPGDDDILLSSPLGQGVAEIRRREGKTVLTDSEGKRYEATNSEDLLEKTLGLHLPLAGLASWVAAQPRPRVPFTAYQDAKGRLVSLEQDGWRMDFGRHQNLGGRWLPGRIFASRGETLEFRLAINKWEIP